MPALEYVAGIDTFGEATAPEIDAYMGHLAQSLDSFMGDGWDVSVCIGARTQVNVTGGHIDPIDHAAILDTAQRVWDRLADYT
jgi:hypothetical protein